MEEEEEDWAGIGRRAVAELFWRVLSGGWVRRRQVQRKRTGREIDVIWGAKRGALVSMVDAPVLRRSWGKKGEPPAVQAVLLSSRRGFDPSLYSRMTTSEVRLKLTEVEKAMTVTDVPRLAGESKVPPHQPEVLLPKKEVEELGPDRGTFKSLR